MDSIATPNAIVRNSLLEGNHRSGVAVLGAHAVLEGLVVRDTLQPPAIGGWGIGVNVQFPSESSIRTFALVRGSVVERSYGTGIVVLDAGAAIEGTVVRDTRPDEEGRGNGVWCRSTGVFAEDDEELSRTAFRSVLVEQSYAAGVILWGVRSTVERTVVRDTLADPAIGTGEDWPGDGLIVVGRPELLRKVELSHSLIQRSARAAIASFGAPVSLRRTTLDCNAIHLNGEQAYELVGFPVEQAYSFEDLGGNRCGCDVQPDTCQVLSSGLTPPEPVEPLEPL
jgi:hypothetical protein